MSSEIPAELDRRGANRHASNWITNDLKKQSEKIDNLSLEIQSLKKALENAIPNQDWDVHRDAHVTYKEWEAEREKQNREQDMREAERRKTINNLKYDMIKWVAGGLIVSLSGVFLLGAETKFRSWLNAPTATPTLEVKK